MDTDTSFQVRQQSLTSGPLPDVGLGGAWHDHAGLGEPLLAPKALPTGDDLKFREAEHRKATGTVWGGIINLSATSMGAGVLALPVAMYYGGWVLGCATLLLFAWLCDVSLMLIVQARRVSGKAGLDEMAEFFYGRAGRIVVKASLISLLFGGSVVLLLVGAQLLTPALQFFALGGHVYSSDCRGPCASVDVPWWAGTIHCATCETPPIWASQSVVTVVLMAVIFPLTLARSLSALSYTSSAAVFAILFVVGCVVAKFVSRGGIEASSTPFVARANMLVGCSLQGVAFCNQFNVVAVYDELPRARRKYMPTIIHTAMLAVVLPVYALASLAGYWQFGVETGHLGNILSGFPDNDHVMLTASIAVALTNVLKYPLITSPLRDTINDMMGWSVHDVPASSAQHGRVRVLSWAARTAQMALLCSLALGLALVLKNLALAFQVIGSTAGVMVSFVLPGALGLAATRAQERRAVVMQAVEARRRVRGGFVRPLDVEQPRAPPAASDLDDGTAATGRGGLAVEDDTVGDGLYEPPEVVLGVWHKLSRRVYSCLLLVCGVAVFGFSVAGMASS